MSEKLCLQWNDFKAIVSSAFGSLRNNHDFADVTLACENGNQFEVHKVILASCSPFFKNLLQIHKHKHQLIYMRGLSSDTLAAVLDFLYFGEANVAPENLNDFLALAAELKLKGLEGEGNIENVRTRQKSTNSHAQTKSEPLSMKSISEKPDYEASSKEVLSTATDLSVPANDEENLFPCKNCDYTTRFSHNLTKHFNAMHTDIMHECSLCDSKYSWKQHLKEHFDSAHEGKYVCIQCDLKASSKQVLKVHFENVHEGKKYVCTQCDFKASSKQQLKEHFESVHEGKNVCIQCDLKASSKQVLKVHFESVHEGKKYVCTQCDFKAASKTSLKVHKDNFHDGKRYYCDQCDYNAAHRMNLKIHIQNIHEGIRYECNECDFKATQKKYLRTHTESKHKGLKYDCSECDFKATHKYGLKRHMRGVHNI